MESDLKENDFSDVVKAVPNNELHSLLEAASNMNFEGDDSFTKVKGEFEKVSSLFDLVKSESSEQDDTKLEESALINDLADSIEESNKSPQEPSENKFEEPTVKLGDELQADKNNDPEDVISYNHEEEIANSNELKDPSSLITQDSPEESKDELQNNNLGLEQEIDDLSDEKFDQSSYDKGYKQALLEFEKTIEQEKNDFLNVTNLLMKVGDDYQGLVENILRQKTFELVSDFIGRELETDTDSFRHQIEKNTKSLITDSKNFLLELNHSDLSILQKYFTSEENRFTLVEGAELRRGEFRITSGSSGLEQVLEVENLQDDR